jgi:hypothetical protein
VILAGINLKFFYWIANRSRLVGVHVTERLKRERTLAIEAQDDLPSLTPFGTRYILAW